MKLAIRTNEQILADRMARFDRMPGPRVGDFLRLPRIDPRVPEFDRFTHDWGDTLQTGGMSGSYYHGGSHLCYSGGLDPGIAKADIVATGETWHGEVWFFDRDIAGKGRGVYFSAPMRIFDLRPGADASQVWTVRCPYHLNLVHNVQFPAGRWCVTKGPYSHRGFDRFEELQEWAAAENIALIRTQDGGYRLDWPGNATA